jgi:Ca-activated chloride channel homolog
MGFLAPLALLGLLAVPLIIAFYMLRLRRPQQPVSSTYLWQQLVRDVEANAPWQRLRRSLLLFLQLILAVLLALLVAQPFLERPAGLAHDLVLVVDASASMSATDEFPDRLTAAKRRAVAALEQLPAEGRVSIVAAAETARVVANEATDRGRIRQAIDSIAPSVAAGDLADALKLAGKLAERARGAEILVVTDDAGGVAPQLSLSVPLRVETVGRERDNQTIAALAVRLDATGIKRSIFVSLANYAAAEAPRRLDILADGVSFDARELTLRPISRTDVVIDSLPQGARVVEARLSQPDAAEADGPADHLALDDAAWAIAPPDRLQCVLLVGPGNAYLQSALTLLPNVALFGATSEQWASSVPDPEICPAREYDLIVFDGGYVPADLPTKPILAFAPPRSSGLGEVTGTLDRFGMGQPAPDEPLLRGVDLTRLHIARTQQIALPAWARAVIPGSDAEGNAMPLLYSGLRDGLPTAVFAFDLRQSDLPLQVAWPILVSNLAGELLGVAPQALEPLAPAAPIELPLSADSAGVRLTLPDGSVQEIARGATGANTVSFVSTGQLGVYRAEPIALPAPAGSARPAATAPAVAGAADDVFMFAVDLFSADESNIAPGDGTRLAALGSADDPAAAEAGVARDEFWPLLVALVLAFLLVEWLVYERDGARRIAGSVRGLRRMSAR